MDIINEKIQHLYDQINDLQQLNKVYNEELIEINQSIELISSHIVEVKKALNIRFEINKEEIAKIKAMLINK